MMLAILTPEQISELLGSESEWYGVLIAAAIGSITLIPGFVAFPLMTQKDKDTIYQKAQ